VVCPRVAELFEATSPQGPRHHCGNRRLCPAFGKELQKTSVAIAILKRRTTLRTRVEYMVPDKASTSPWRGYIRPEGWT